MMLFHRTGCESREKVKINKTEIKIERDYIDGTVFESIVSRSNSDTKYKCITKYEVWYL